jgi:hypothetical protein
MNDIERRIGGFIDKFTPAIAAQLRDARQRLRAHFPRGVEMVFDNYNALVFGIGAADRTRESFISIAGYPKWVTLFFLDGAGLDDPEGLLEGDGKQVRGIRLKTPADLDTPAVRALIEQAIAPHRAALDAVPALSTVIKAEVAKQRPRRPAPAKA